MRVAAKRWTVNQPTRGSLLVERSTRALCQSSIDAFHAYRFRASEEMPSIVPIALQISEEQQQVINKIAASVTPLLGSCDCVVLTLILRKDGVESAEGQTTKRQPTAPETPIPPEQETFSVAEAARLLNVSPTTVYRLIYIGQLKILRSFGGIRISKQQLDRLLSQTVTYTPRKRR